MRPLRYHRASGIDDAIAASEGGSNAVHFLAGGTTMIDLVKLDVIRPETLVDVGKLPLSEIETGSEGGLRIGANVRNSDLAWNARARRDYPALSQALLSGASPQLRNMATVAGNLMQRTRCPYYRDNYSACNKRNPGSGCAAMEGYNRMHAVLGGSDACVAVHPSDMCVAMAIYDAVITVVGERGERAIPIRDFHLLPGETPHEEFALAPGELITRVDLPVAPQGSAAVYIKSRDRAVYEFALASVAALVVLENGRVAEARIALGGVATKPWRAVEAEKALLGQRPSDEAIAKAAELALSGARPLRRNAFKIPLAKNIVRRALINAIEMEL